MQAALRQLIPVRDYPRCVIQITLQVAETPENAYVNAKLVQAQLVGFIVSELTVCIMVELTFGHRTSPSFPRFFTQPS